MNGYEQQMRSLIKCMADRDVMELVKVEKNLSIDKAIKGRKSCDLVKNYGEPMVIKAYSGVILMALEFFNTGQQMSEMQAIQTASLMIEQYPAETIEDLVLCLKNVKSARYGKIFNRIDGQLLFEWFRLYLDEKYERFEQIKHMEKVSYRVELNEEFLPIAEKILKLTQLEDTGKKESLAAEKRITAEKHFERFKDFVKSLSIDELDVLHEQYEKESSRAFYNNFDNYLEVIKRQKEELNNKNVKQ